ncbi:MAG: hypothetical protein WA476_05025 [Acidobacteriaceae bacterium]
MRTRIVAALAYVGAAVTLVVAACVPFVLTGVFTRTVAHAVLHVDAAYTGGPVARTLARNGYQVVVYQPMQPHALQQVDPFVQIAFKPLAALPEHVTEEIDLDGDGQADVRVSFHVPAARHARPGGSVVALNGKYQSFTMPGDSSFSRLMVQSDDAVVVRVPLNGAQRGRRAARRWHLTE